MNKEDILELIWGASYKKDYFPYLAIIDRREKKFTEKQWLFYPELASYLIQPELVDMFFSPLLFSGSRSNENVALPGVMFADLDGVLPHKGRPLTPSIAWSTSPGNFQAVWLLAEGPPDRLRWAALNRRLTYATHADKGGWHASKLLRIPHTRNYKRMPQVDLGHILWVTDKTYDYSELDAILPVEVHLNAFDSPPPPTPTQGEWQEMVRTVWGVLPLGVRSDMAAKHKKDRSYAVVLLNNDLRRLEFGPAERFRLIWGVAWNKWRTDRDNPAMLWGIVTNGE